MLHVAQFELNFPILVIVIIEKANIDLDTLGLLDYMQKVDQCKQ